MKPTCSPAFLVALSLLSCLPLRADPPELYIVRDGGSPTPVIVEADASQETRAAADTLVTYIEKISGAKRALLEGAPTPLPVSAIWIGIHPELAGLMRGTRLGFEHPEEILIACDGKHLVIAGRDRFVADKQIEFGTANAVYTFLQRNLEVRWLRPWDRAGAWTDLIPRATLAVPVSEYRFHPPFRLRHFWPSRYEWDVRQRLTLGSYKFHAGHGFTDWWEKHHEAHPEWFALRGTMGRTPENWGKTPNPQAVKLCVSNPEVWTQWLENAEALFRADPTRLTVSGSPNDGGGYCVCDNCRAWDHPEGPFAGADRYVKFWSILARGLQERFPDRDVWVGAHAYASYKNPPLAEPLARNIAISYVGHFPFASDEFTERDKAAWLGWAEKASAMVFRPNLFHYSGGFWGLPCVALRRTMRDFRFLADNKCIGLMVDSLPNDFNAQGVQYYLMAQLAYDPYQDGEALLRDYYQRAFGPAAGAIETYYNRMEQAHEEIINWKGFRHSSGNGKEVAEICRQVYTPELLAAAEEWMRTATELATQGPERHRPRVEAIRDGFEFLKLQVEILHVMKQVREGRGADRQEAVRKAVELCAERDVRIKEGKGRFRKNFQDRVLDYLGPPSEIGG